MRNYIVYLSDNSRIGQTEFYGGDYSPEDVIADAKTFYSRPYKIEVMEIEGDLSDDEIVEDFFWDYKDTKDGYSRRGITKLGYWEDYKV